MSDKKKNEIQFTACTQISHTSHANNGQLNQFALLFTLTEHFFETRLRDLSILNMDRTFFIFHIWQIQHDDMVLLIYFRIYSKYAICSLYNVWKFTSNQMSHLARSCCFQRFCFVIAYLDEIWLDLEKALLKIHAF